MNEWSTIRKLMWLKRFKGGGGPSWIWETLTGEAPLTLLSAIHHAIHSLTQFGKVEQRNLPQGYTELDYIQSDGSQYIDLNTTLDQDDVIEIEFELTASQNSRNIFGYRSGASSNNIMLFLGGTNNRVFIDFNNSDYAPYRLSCDCTVGTKYKAVISKSRRAFLSADGTVLAENTTLCEDTISCPSAYLFHASGSPAYSNEGLVNIYSCAINGKRDLVGAKDASNVVQMYDKVTDAPFVNAGTGSFTAGSAVKPSPERPVDIVTNNGVIKVSRNLCDVVSANIVVGKYINNSGVETADIANFFYAPYVPVTPGGTYTMATSSSIWYFSVMQYDSSKNFLRRSIWGATNTPVGTEKTFSVGADCAYIRFGSNMKKAAISESDVLAVSWMLTETATAQAYRPYGEIYTDDTPEVLTISATGAETQTVTGIPTLLSVGDYKDEVELVGGDVDRNVWAVVFDGSDDEPWTFGGGNVFYLYTNETAYPGLNTGGVLAPLCNRLKPVASGWGNFQPGEIEYSGGDTCIELAISNVSTVLELKALLASWVAEGKPLIIGYPRETVTEQGTPHALHTNAGTNVVDVLSNVDPVSMTVEYAKSNS